MNKADNLLVISYDLAYALIEYEDFIKRINNFNENERKFRLEKCDEFTNRISELRRSYILELKGASDQDKQYWLPQLQTRMEHYKYLQKQVENKRHEINRENLIAQVHEEAPMDQGVQQLARRGDEVQDKTQDALTNMKNLVLDAEEIGINTAAKMDAQIEQMENMGSKFERINKNLDVAKAKVRSIKYACLKDKFLIALISLNTLLVIVIVCIYLFWRKSGHTDPDPDLHERSPLPDYSINGDYEFNHEDFSVYEGTFKPLYGSETTAYADDGGGVRDYFMKGVGFILGDAPSSTSNPVTTKYTETTTTTISVIGIVDGRMIYSKCTSTEPEDFANNIRYAIRGYPFGIVDFSYLEYDCDAVMDLSNDHLFAGYRLFIRHAADVDLS